MTTATPILESKTLNTTPTMFYEVGMSQPGSHLFEVKLQVKNWQASVLDLKMPVWTPGSYLIREYARQVQDFTALSTSTQTPLVSHKVSKNHYCVETENVSAITITYRVFANELTVRTNHLDITHGYFNGAALFFFIPGLEKQEIVVKIVPPNGNWQVTNTLPNVPGEVNTFVAKDFDDLVDTPFEIGTHKVIDFEVSGKKHHLAIWGRGNYNSEKMIQHIQKIIEVEAQLYGDLPYEKYLFLLHLTNNSFGGLEHKDSCSLIYSRFGFRAKEKYDRFMQLVAHEFFHLWNVKRIRPKGIEKFDYEQENYTPSLWFSEGTTSYYDMLVPLKAGIYNTQTYRQILSQEITRYLNTPGRLVQTATESSFDAWIKHYRRDTNSDNSQISYYLKGELISLMLDLLIRRKFKNQRSLDDVMRQMWLNFGKDEIGFTEEQLRDVIQKVAQTDLSDFFKRYLDGTEEMPIGLYLEPFGLQLTGIGEEQAPPFLGVRLIGAIIKFVESGSPAELAGIDTEDELLAIDGIRITVEQLQERLKDYQAGDIIHLSLFHQDELRTLPVKLAQPKPMRYEVQVIEGLSAAQKELQMGWLGNI